MTTTTKLSDNKVSVTADQWFRNGRRVLYDPIEKEIVENKTSPHTLSVFERTALLNKTNPQEVSRWITMLPGFPDGSYGWSKVDALLEKEHVPKTPRLYVEFVGQGDSDKPNNYNYNTMERADLVEAQWRAHGVRSTVLVTFDYSSIVMLELLQRQHDRLASGEPLETRIEHVFAINGGLFIDGHSHPWDTTPLLKTPILGRFVTWIADTFPSFFAVMVKPMFSPEYKITHEEIMEIRNAVTRRNGMSFLHNAAGFVDEHARYADRWNVKTIYDKLDGSVSLHLVGSEKDQFEYNQILLSKERFAKDANVVIETIRGGHMATSEQAEFLADCISKL